MEQLNRIELRGYVGSCKTQNVGDSTVARINLATSRAFKNRNNEATIETTWTSVTVWSGKDIPAEKLSSIVKGSKLFVAGRLRNQRFTGSDGVERTITEVVANKLEILPEDTSLAYES